MNRPLLRRLHRWVGLLCCFLLLLFSLSGILLNHRQALASWQLSRRWLPASYAYHNWDQGLLRGTLRVDSTVWIYGNAGIFRTDTLGQTPTADNAGLPSGVDCRNVRAMVATPDGRQWAATLFGLYARRGDAPWQRVATPTDPSRLSDLSLRGDTLLLLSRSQLYIAPPPYRDFQRIALPAATDDDGRVSLFRAIWLLHSGALFGLAGRLAMDALALVFIFLSLTGITLFLFPRLIRRIGLSHWRQRLGRWHKSHLRWHDLVGRKTIVLTLFLVLTGWALRPPLLIALVQTSIPRLPFTVLDTPNPWDDRLRMIRWDEQEGDFLLSTNTGFYRFHELGEPPHPVRDAPPVSVMGLNVFERHASGAWIVGSFGGIYLWQRDAPWPVDFLTGQPAPQRLGHPFGRMAVAGYSSHFAAVTDGQPLIVQHHGGTPLLPMPDAMRHLPISLWNFALELHNGRLYTFLVEPALFFIFVAGLLVLLTLYTGWRLRRKQPNQPPRSL